MQRHKANVFMATMLALASLALVASCGQSGGAAAYLSRNQNGAIYIHWTASGGNVNGSMTVFTANDFNPQGGDAATLDFTGTVSGNSVTFNFPAGGQYAGMHGVIGGATLHLTVPNGTGALSTLDLVSASDADYNAAVATFAARASAAIASDQIKTNIDAPVVTAAQELATDISDLQGLGTVEQQMPGSRQNQSEPFPTSMQKWLDELSKGSEAFKQAVALGNAGSPGSDFDSEVGISYSTYFCEQDYYSPQQIYVQGYHAAVTKITSAIEVVNAAADQLDAVVVSNPRAAPPSPTADQGRSAAQAAQEALDSAESAWMREVAAATAIRLKAKAIYDAAATLATKHGLTPSTCTWVNW